MSARVAAWIWGVTITVAPAALFAQEVPPPQEIGSSTPPELRDFRLDAPPPRPASEPNQTQRPVVQPVADAPQTEPEQSPVERVTATRQPARASTQTPELSVPPQSKENAAQPGFSAESIVAPTTDVASTPQPDPPPTIASVPSANNNRASWYVLLLAGLSLAVIGLGFAYFRRRNRTAEVGRTQSIYQPSPPTKLAQPKKASLAPNAPAPAIAAEFNPEVAQLSIASLAITGRLKISNTGSLPIDNLILRSHMISAQESQAEAIEAFYTAKPAGSLQTLGSLQKGETIDVVIEIRLPRAELPTFRWSEREFVAPIILIHLSGQSVEKKCELRLSHLVGRSGAAEGSRMKPLETDRGPKRFAGVCARPVFA